MIAPPPSSGVSLLPSYRARSASSFAAYLGGSRRHSLISSSRSFARQHRGRRCARRRAPRASTASAARSRRRARRSPCAAAPRRNVEHALSPVRCAALLMESSHSSRSASLAQYTMRSRPPSSLFGLMMIALCGLPSMLQSRAGPSGPCSGGGGSARPSRPPCRASCTRPSTRSTQRAVLVHDKVPVPVLVRAEERRPPPRFHRYPAVCPRDSKPDLSACTSAIGFTSNFDLRGGAAAATGTRARPSRPGSRRAGVPSRRRARGRARALARRP